MEGLLHRMQHQGVWFRTRLGQSLNGADGLCILHRADRQQAGPAEPDAASEFGARQPQFIPQDPEQFLLRLRSMDMERSFTTSVRGAMLLYLSLLPD